MGSWFRLLNFVMLGFFLVVFVWSAHSVFILDNETVYAENGRLETTQAILLAISCIVYLAPIALKKEPDKLILLLCSLLCCSFALRELDIERLDIPNAWKIIGSGVGRNLILAAAFLSLFSYAAFNFTYYRKAVIQFLRSKSGILLILGGLFLLVGSMFEKSHTVTHNAFFEEISELGGYCFILLSAFAANPGFTRSPRHTASSSRWTETLSHLRGR